MTKTTATSAVSLLSHEDGYDPIEDRLRANIRATIEVSVLVKLVLATIFASL